MDAFDLTYDVVDLFFDRAAVQQRVLDRRQKALSKAGAFVRRKARDKLRKGKKPSKPGTPPKVHSPEPNLKTIFFAWDPGEDGVVVGPIALSGKKGPGPAGQEFGDSWEITEELFAKGWFVVKPDEPNPYRHARRTRRANLAARPFMAPALDEANDDLPEYIRDLF